jgi:hypothetical protein
MLYLKSKQKILFYNGKDGERSRGKKGARRDGRGEERERAASIS